ncbi:MAG TPA: inorganic pyrophosphatase [Balneolaceae bacterium]|nr:inorganic pyrophosphatase [Balneolaceae bacterium]
MEKSDIDRFLKLSELFYKPHPWHGISIGEDTPETVRVFIEIVPGDTMKYELEKASGYLKVDRPQRFSNILPFPYGFIPQTYCGESIGEFCMQKTGRSSIVGDGDPLDICVLTERSIPHGNIILDAKPIGGLRMIDRNEADDKIIAVMQGDAVYGSMDNISDVPKRVLDRLTHYFLTYKEMPSMDPNKSPKCEITNVYDWNEAYEVIKRSTTDYNDEFAASKRELISLIRKELK